VSLAGPGGARDLTARWVVDASGRAGLLKRQLGLVRPSTHGANAAWWRFRSRNNIPKKADEAGLTYRDYAAIRELAGDHGQFEDVWTKTADGLIYRSSGLTLDPVSRDEVTGKVHLKNDDGRYDDIYTKTANGWRFKSRLYVPTDDAPARPTR